MQWDQNNRILHATVLTQRKSMICLRQHPVQWVDKVIKKKKILSNLYQQKYSLALRLFKSVSEISLFQLSSMTQEK